MQSLAENQPFVDGNKRTAWICGKVFLELHGVMYATDEEGLALFRNRIVNGATVEEIATWIARHMSPLFPEADHSSTSLNAAE